MARVGRNEPCPCGSGRKAKRCCGVTRGPSQDQIASAHLSLGAKQAAVELLGCDDVELGSLRSQVMDLPKYELALHAPLPRFLPAALERLSRALKADDPEQFRAAVPEALSLIDTPKLRMTLAQAVAGLRDSGRIPRKVAAYALIDLGKDGKALVASSMIRALEVRVGISPTPAGLHVAYTATAFK